MCQLVNSYILEKHSTFTRSGVLDSEDTRMNITLLENVSNYLLAKRM